jgi:IS5 family transposase
MMNKINTLISWKNIDALLLEYYDVGRSTEGADAYPPLMLLKCLLLQKCLRPGGIARSGFHIPSDPELENQINDRISFKKFLGISIDKPSPDHSTFSRFRGRLSKETMPKLGIKIVVMSEEENKVLMQKLESVWDKYIAKLGEPAE